MDLRDLTDRPVVTTLEDRVVLALDGIHKHFGATIAVDDATLHVRTGTIHAVVGENGAGKTTLMRVAYGMTQPTAGLVSVNGVSHAFRAPIDAINAGIGMVHQHFTLVPTMSVQENLALGRHGLLNVSEMRDRVLRVCERTAFALDPSALVETLSVGAQQRVEIAKAIARNPALLILDEPTAVLTPTETTELLRWLRTYVADGHAVVLITHKLRDALEVADDITVMRLGKVTLSASAIQLDREALTTAILGEPASTLEKPAMPVRPPVLSGPVFMARDISLFSEQGRQVMANASFTVHAGECVGLAAIEGSGQYELLRALSGRQEIRDGTLVRPASVGYVPADRHRDAVLLDRSLTENVALRGAGGRRGRMEWTTWRVRTVDAMREFDVRASSPDVAMRTLSGGNQQKFVLAREVSRQGEDAVTSAIVADNPTRGLDVRAAAAVHARLRHAAAHGAAVIVHSSDIDELLSLASRVLVLHGARVQEVACDRDAIGRAMIGA